MLVHQEKIGPRAFEACRCLRYVNFAGTVEECVNIVKGGNWLYDTSIIEIVCEDGVVKI